MDEIHIWFSFITKITFCVIIFLAVTFLHMPWQHSCITAVMHKLLHLTNTVNEITYPYPKYMGQFQYKDCVSSNLDFHYKSRTTDLIVRMESSLLVRQHPYIQIGHCPWKQEFQRTTTPSVGLDKKNANIKWVQPLHTVIRFMVNCIMPPNFRP